MDFVPVYIYFTLVLAVTLLTLGASAIFPSIKGSTTKFEPYESGIKTTTNLLQKRIPLQHYLIALMFLIFDIEVVFLYPWATIAKELGPFAFYEMAFFLLALFIGFIYVWKKGGLEWE